MDCIDLGMSAIESMQVMHEFLDNMAMSRYGYIEEYKKLIELKN
jgi:hypothetical protein